MINLVKTKLTFKTKQEALKFHLLAISTEEGLKLSSSDIDVIIEIYKNGYDKDLFSRCVEKKYFKSEQTVRNSVAKLTKYDILKKSRGHREVNPMFLPSEAKNNLIFSYDVIYEDLLLDADKES